MSGPVVVTASAGSFPGLLEALRAIPVPVEEAPLMSFAPPTDWAPVDRALAELGVFEAVAFTSPRAAGAFAARAAERGVAPTAAGHPTLWAAGAGTAQALGNRLGVVRRPPERAVGEKGAAAALAEVLLEEGVTGPVLFPCGDIRRDELPVRLRHEGVEVVDVVCYRSVLADEVEARRAAERARVLVVASPSVADLLARACPAEPRPPMLAVGPTTAAAARASGWPAGATAAKPTVEALAAGVRALLESR